jgi:hypothetical protein
MKTDHPKFLPAARREGIISKEVESELLVYDRTRDEAHCLNELAAAIWKRCDGRTAPAEIAGSIAEQFGLVLDESVVWLALADLRRKHLLTQSADGTRTIRARSTVSRRQAIRRFGIGAAIALPIVVTIIVPPSGTAGSCRGAGANCETGSQCCSGVCSGGSCLGASANSQGRIRGK